MPKTPQKTAAASPRCAVVIPVYNHAATIGYVVERALRLGYPIFVIDDGSTDATPSILAGWKDIRGITVIRHPGNRGKGAALLTGLAAAASVADFAVTLDADGQHDPADAASLLAAIPPGTRPLVVGTREGMLNDRRIAWTSRFGRKFSNFWVRVAGGPPLSDTQSGYRLYPIAETLAIRSLSRRFQFEVEIIVMARWAGIPIREAPVSVTYAPAGGRVSHFRPFVDFCRNGETFIRLMLMRAFCPPIVRRWLISR